MFLSLNGAGLQHWLQQEGPEDLMLCERQTHKATVCDPVTGDTQDRESGDGRGPTGTGRRDEGSSWERASFWGDGCSDPEEVQLHTGRRAETRSVQAAWPVTCTQPQC